MFGSLGGAEILFILVLALLIFGPRKLPQIGRTVGRAMGEFRRATQDLRSSLEQEVATAERRDTREKLNPAGAEVALAVQPASPATVARGAVGSSPAPPAAAGGAGPQAEPGEPRADPTDADETIRQP